MKQLIPIDDFGMFCDSKGTARANSLKEVKLREVQYKCIQL